VSVLAKVLGFSLALSLCFTLVTHLLPQVEGRVPQEIEVDIDALTMDEFIALGEYIFKRIDSCTLCHNDRGRAPDILRLNMIQTIASRLADGRYQGKARDAEGYIRESMLAPSVYVVDGYGKVGAEHISPMKAVDKPPMLLSDIEIDAVIAFLQAKDGGEVTVALPSSAEDMPVAPALPVDTGEARKPMWIQAPDERGSGG